MVRTRCDIFDIALNHTHQRNVYAQLTDDRLIETSVSEYFENRIQFSDWFRTVAGVRGDFFTAAVTDKSGDPNGGTASSFLASPKHLEFHPAEPRGVHVTVTARF